MTHMSSFSRIGISVMLFNKANIALLFRSHSNFDFLTISFSVLPALKSQPHSLKYSIRLDLGSHEVRIKPSYRDLAPPGGIEH